MTDQEFGPAARTPAGARATHRGAWLLAAAMLALANPARAECSRPIRVPVAPLGMSVITSGGATAGIYPELLKRIESDTGCQFELSVVPRARLEAMFAGVGADLLVPATRTASRDAHGDFVPMMRSRPLLISLASARPPIESLEMLAERRELRVVLVRGFDYGAPYQRLMETLRQQKRLVLEADIPAVARALERNLADVTLMAPSIFTGTLLQDSRTRALVERLRFEVVPELGWGESGIYVSRKLPAGDRERLIDALERGAHGSAFWKSVQRHYPPGSYEEGLKPLAGHVAK